MIRRPASLLLIAATLSATLTAAAVLLPRVPFVYEPSSQRIALETAATLIAFLTSYLLFGRYRGTRRLDQLTAATVLALLGLANLLIVAIIVSGPDQQLGWELVIGAHVAAAILFVAVAYMPIARPRRPLRTALALAFGSLAVLVAADAVIHTLAGTLPGAMPQPAYGDTEAHFERHVGITTVQLAAGAAFIAAAVGLARRSRRTGDELLAWLSVAALFAASAQVNYLLVPPWRLDLVNTGDVFRLLFYAVLLVGALREIGSYWQRLAENAVLEERRRIARELHDGLTQELAFIQRRARLLADQDPMLVRQITGATERAIDASRRTIAVLTRPLDEPLDRVLAQAAQEVAARSGLRLSLSLAQDIEVSRETQEVLVKVACEAITNAARHADANGVRLELVSGRPRRMRIVDDGVGFDPETARQPGEGFGLAFMGERVGEVGARLAVRSVPGVGTTVEVELP